MSITLAEAVADLASVFPSGDVERHGDTDVVDATHDSRQVRSGWLYCAVPGGTVDGHEFASEAVASGAAALLVERRLGLDVPQVVVPSVRRATGPVAAAIHGRPSERVLLVGVTGTNGKTTSTYLLEAVFGAAAMGTGVIGTVETRIHGTAQPGVRTTPEGTDLQRLLATMYDRGVDAVSMEVSSHGLAQHRIDGAVFDVAVFTNLSQDHLDFHGSMEAYYGAKARLFTPALSRGAVVCVDDDWGRRLAREAAVPVTTFGTAADAHVRVTDIESGLDGTRCRLAGGGHDVELFTVLVGAHNALN
ncbi:MAG: Mur ligase family protein, partial [Nitriliruptorales bacterium]